MKDKLGSALKSRFATVGPNDRFEVQIFLRREPLSAWVATMDRITTQDRALLVIRAQEAAQQSLSDFFDEIALLPGAMESFREIWRHWINNSLAAEVSSDVLQKILESPKVEHVELVPRARIEDLLHGHSEPVLVDLPAQRNVPDIAKQVTRVEAPLLWDQGLRGDRVLVAVIDTGINFDHPDLINRKWGGGPMFPHHGVNFETPDHPPQDEDGHGTCCAGLIAGDGSSGIFATGIAPEAILMALRVGGLESHAWSAFEFAIEHGADVISMSLGWNADKNPNYLGWRWACEFLLKVGIVFICSAGNDASLDEDQGSSSHIPQNIAAPAICPPPWRHPAQRPGGLASAIACGETDLKDRLDPESSHGPGAWETDPFTDYPFKNGGQGLLKPDLCGPGRGSMTCNSKFEAGQELHIPFGGTSAAAATVAGCAVLLVEAAKRFGKPVVPRRIQKALEKGATAIAGQTTKQNTLGSGRVNVLTAYRIGALKDWWQ
jgi:subtilisin family serine protease